MSPRLLDDKREASLHDAEARRARVAALAGAGAEAALSMVLAALGDEDFRVRGEATRVAATLVPRDAVAHALVDRLDERDNVSLRNAVAEALSALGAVAIPHVRAAMDRLDADGRKLCVDVCGSVPSLQSVALLLEALADGNHNVACAAAEALAVARALEPKAQGDVIFALISLLPQGDGPLCAAALHALSELDAKVPRVYLDDAARVPSLRPLVARLRAQLEAPPDSNRELAEVRMTTSDYARFAAEVRLRTGIVLHRHGKSRVEKALRDRVALHELESFEAYLNMLFSARGQDATAAEWSAVADCVTVNESWFFRHHPQLQSFANQVVPYLAERASNTGRLTLWSAGCSTGEEAYTLAMILHDAPALLGYQIRVFCTDLSARAVAFARAGIYDGTAVRRNVSDDLRTRHFETLADGRASVRLHLRDMCHFSVANLLEAERMRLYGPFDAVFCRNVLFYFDEGTRDAVLAQIHGLLVPGGVLCLGHSDALGPKTTQFEPVPLAEDLVYRRPFVHHFGAEAHSPAHTSPERDFGKAAPPTPHRR